MDNENIQVVKRNGKKVAFNSTKIALAIQKGFDSVENEEENKYSDKDIQKVLGRVFKKISENYDTKIKIEEIQDLIEDSFRHYKYDEVYQSFSTYREKRKESREMFFDDKKRHKFLKTLEALGLKKSTDEDAKRENANVDGDTAMGTMLQYGSTVSKEFALCYLMKKKYATLHEEGYIHIHDLDFMAMGTTTCNQLDLSKLFKTGFSTGHGYLRPPKDIMSYGALAAIVIQANQNDQHGGQAIPALDYYLAPGVIFTFKKQLKQTLSEYLDLNGFVDYVNMNTIAKEVDKLTTINIDDTYFDKFIKNNEVLRRMIQLAIEKAYAKTNRATYQAMESFIHNLNTMNSRAGAQVPFSSVNFGTDISEEGRMVIRNYLYALDAGLGHGETPIFPIAIFKVKDGINFKDGDPNYDLFKLSCQVSAKRLFPNFSFIDAPFNLKTYKSDDYRTEVGYMGCRTRVLANVADPNKSITPGRGNLSFTSINLVRLGIKHGILNNEKPNLRGFYEELDQLIDDVRGQLLERLEIQGNKRVYNFPFLMGQGIWMDSDKLKKTDKVRRVLKHGTLTIGFIGLAECLKALLGKHHGEDEQAYKTGYEIIKHMRDKCDEYSKVYNLNFSLIATPAEGLSGRFTRLDRAIYGKIKGVTDRNYYTNSFHIPVYFNISIKDKITKEAPFHALTNGGHITYIELDGDTTNNLEAFESVIRLMKEAGIGYGAVNHPVDRDPVCGYVGVINDICPRCGRKENEGISFEKLKSLDCGCSRR